MKSIRISEQDYKEMVLPLFDIQSQLRASEVLMYVTDLAGMDHERKVKHFSSMIDRHIELKYIYRHYQQGIREKYDLPLLFEIENDTIVYENVSVS